MKNPVNKFGGIFGSTPPLPRGEGPGVRAYCFLAAISNSSILMAESLMIVPGPKMATAPADTSKISRKSFIFIVIKNFFVLLQPEKWRKTAMYLYKSLIINHLINWEVKTLFQTIVI